MKLFFLLIFLIPTAALAQSPEINIIPKPTSVKPGVGAFKLTKRTTIIIWDEQARDIAKAFNAALIGKYGFQLKVTPQGSSLKNAVLIMRGASFQDGTDYLLSVDSKVIRIFGNQEGLFHGIQSLLQLLPEKSGPEIRVPAVSIEDRPRFPYRGMHLDVGRHFMPVDFVKRYIDLMSQYKLNYFHWHLTEDQGWRIEIKKYPKLTEIGSKRPETVKERNLTPYIGDGVPVEGFYTQEQIKDVVAYAKARYITVVPEIELPGHSSAALAAYPEFGCKQDYKYKVQTTWGIFKEVYCPTEATFKFLEDVITEVVALFPDSPYIHIGGDEVLKDMWKDSPAVAELKAKENLKHEHEVQSYFIRRMEKFINSKGKKIIGWDEILEGGLAPNATVMSWRGMRGGIEAAKSKHDVIMTPTDYAYFDYGQGDPAYEPLNIGSYVPLEKVYSFEPVPKELTAEEARYVIGGQANVWTEYMKTPATVEYMAFPRMLALSEVLWSQAKDRNFADFQKRLAANLPRLDRQNVNYRIPEPAGLKNLILAAGEQASIELRPPVDGAKIYYTIDGSTPDERSTLYTKPLAVDVAQGSRIDLKTVVQLANGRKSVVYAATVLRDTMREPVTFAETKPGLLYETVVTNADGSDPSRQKGETRSIFLPQFEKQIDLKRPFGVTFDGYFKAPQDGIYEFQIDSTWDATLVLGGRMIIDDAGTKDRKVKTTILPLKAGWHKVLIRYNHRGGDAAFRVRWGIKGQGLRQFGGGEFVH